MTSSVSADNTYSRPAPAQAGHGQPMSTPELHREKRIELALAQLEHLPTLPAIALKIVEVTSSDTSNAKEVVRLIQSDQSLTTRILQLVHRSDSGIRSDIATIDRAVVLLGFETIRSAVLAVSIFQTFQQDGGTASNAAPTRFSREEFWKHSVGVATCAELLAEASGTAGGRIDPSEAFVCGLVHDVGKVALDAALPKSFSKVVEAADLLRGNIADVERQVIGLDHMIVGKRLAERWQLPATMREAIWLHGQHPAALPPGVRSPKMVNLITLADSLVRESHLGWSGNYQFAVPRAILAEACTISEDKLAGITGKLVERIETKAKAMGLGDSSSGELYQQALAQANRELGKVSSQLAVKNRRLAIRAKFFDALASFHGELRPDAPTSLVLQAIGQTATQVLESGVAASNTPTGIPTIAFSLTPGQDYADIAAFDATGTQTHTLLAECPSRPPPSAALLDTPVVPAAESLEWLLAVTSPLLPSGQRYWICLESDGQTIGGILWSGNANEAERLSPQKSELQAIACGWSLALRTAQIRQEARELAEQLAETNRRLQSAQTELLRKRTIITVGEMAAGAAHELNNPLAVICGRSQLLAATLTEPKQQAAAKLIADQAQRLSDIITDLMVFAKPEQPKVQLTPAVAVIQAALAELKTRNDPGTRKLTITAPADLPPLELDPAQLKDALVEILDNAVHATDPATGKIEITAAFDPYGQHIVISVIDNGHGMDDATLRRAFDPFFSHKAAGRRRGMGLAKALRYAEVAGGSIRLESHPQQATSTGGTRALVLLPVAKQVATPATSAA
jgi:signal transduction histidine kinase/HD-like signal output (HDOD) protein